MEIWVLPRSRGGQGGQSQEDKITVRAAASLPHTAKPPLQHLPQHRQPETWLLCGNDCIPSANALRNINIKSQANIQVSEGTKDTIITSSLTCDCHQHRLLDQEGKLNSQVSASACQVFPFFLIFLLPWQPNATGKASPRLPVWKDKVLAVSATDRNTSASQPGTQQMSYRTDSFSELRVVAHPLCQPGLLISHCKLSPT